MLHEGPLLLPLQALVPFHNLGLLIGLFSPRCADLWPATRQEAVSCVHALLYLQLGYEGEPLAGQSCWREEGWSLGLGGQGSTCPASLCLASEGFSRDYRDDVAEQLLALKEGLVHPDPAVLFHTCHGIAQVPAGVAPSQQPAPSTPRALQGAGWVCHGASGLALLPPSWGQPSEAQQQGRQELSCRLQRAEEAAPACAVSPHAGTALLLHLVSGPGPRVPRRRALLRKEGREGVNGALPGWGGRTPREEKTQPWGTPGGVGGVRLGPDVARLPSVVLCPFHSVCCLL